MRILGIDIGNGTAVCCLLEERPAEPRKFVRSRKNFQSFKATIEDFKQLLELKPDIAIVEPTGMNYARVWIEQLETEGIEVRMISHRAAANHRENLDLPDKEDETDSFVIADYSLLHLDNPNKFLRTRPLKIAQMREIVLRLDHLQRVKNPIINRLKQDLAWQFPEISKDKFDLNGKIPPILCRWIAGRKGKSKRIQDLYKNTFGLGIQESAKLHAERLCNLYEEEINLENNLENLIKDEEFKPYIRALTYCGIPLRASGIIISQIFPFEDFLGENGKPIIEYHDARQATVEIRKAQGKPLNKPVAKHISMRRFEKMLGLAPVERSSGDDKNKKITGGAALCRKTLWQLVFSRIDTIGKKIEKGQRVTNQLDLQLYNWQQERADKPVKIRRMKTASKWLKIIFHKLCEEIK